MPIPTRMALVSFGLAAAAQAVHAQQPIGLQLFVGYDAQTEYETVYLGETQPIWLQTDRPAYVAIFEITPRGDLQLLRPYYLDEVVRTGRGTQFIAVGDPFRPYWGPAGAGIGYLFAVASDDPIRVPRHLSGVGSFFRTSSSFNYHIFNVGFRSWDVIDEVAAATGATEVAVIEYISFPSVIRRAALRVPAFLGGSVLVTRVASADTVTRQPPEEDDEPRERERWRPRNGERLQGTGGITVVAYDASWRWTSRWEDTTWRSNVWNRRRTGWASFGSDLPGTGGSWSRATPSASSSASSTSWRQRAPSESSPSSDAERKRSWTGHRDR